MDCTKIKFSESGAYLACIFNKGAKIRAGRELSLIRTLQHFGIKDIKFSKNDTYVATYNGVSGPANGNQNIVVWNLLSGSKLRHFKCTKEDMWTNFDWSFDEQYCACIIEQQTGENFLCVYESNTMTMFADQSHETKARRPIQVLNPQSFRWANTKNEICFFCWNHLIGPEASLAGVA